MNLKIIALFAVVIILIYVLYVYYHASSAIATSLINLNNTNSSVSITDNPNSYQYTFGIWVYVNSWNNMNQKPLFTIPNQVNVYFDTTTPTLFVDISQNCSTGSGSATPPMIVTDNFPIQKWTYVTIVVDNYFVDMYVDGKMVKSVKMNCMQSVSNATNTSVYLGGNPAVVNDIMLTRFYRWSYVLAPQDVWKQYASGNGVSSTFATYGINVDVMRNNQVQNTIKLF
jgi:Concanavalin A-like lectin/glucanases superfamily